MDRHTVSTTLRLFHGLHFKATLHGFDIGSGDYRLVHGGGISGTNRLWWIEHRNGSEKTRMVSTPRALRRLLTEWCAGEPPVPRAGFTAYARSHRTRFGEHFGWFFRRTSVKPKVA